MQRGSKSGSVWAVVLAGGEGERVRPLVLTAKLETLWALGWQCFPEMMPRFEHVEQTVRVVGAVPALDEVYVRMPRRNFSSGLLARVPEHVAVIEAGGLLWSDWGKPERIVNTLLGMGRQPAFPLELIAGTLALEHAS